MVLRNSSLGEGHHTSTTPPLLLETRRPGGEGGGLVFNEQARLFIQVQCSGTVVCKLVREFMGGVTLSYLVG